MLFQIVTKTNIALGKFASIKSVYTAEDHAGRAVDGNPADRMVHSRHDLPIWFYVDFGQTACVYNIRILNREGICKNAITLPTDLAYLEVFCVLEAIVRTQILYLPIWCIRNPSAFMLHAFNHIAQYVEVSDSRVGHLPIPISPGLLLLLQFSLVRSFLHAHFISTKTTKSSLMIL